METKEKLIKILDEYYGESRSDDHKEEVAEFIDSNLDVIFEIMSKDDRFDTDCF